jgi:hypothetical protein
MGGFQNSKITFPLIAAREVNALYGTVCVGQQWAVAFSEVSSGKW